MDEIETETGCLGVMCLNQDVWIKKPGCFFVINVDDMVIYVH